MLNPAYIWRVGDFKGLQYLMKGSYAMLDLTIESQLLRLALRACAHMEVVWFESSRGIHLRDINPASTQWWKQLTFNT